MENHSLFVLHQDLRGSDNDEYYYNDLYNIVADYLKKGYAIIYAVENNSEDTTIKNLAKAANIDAEDYVRKEALTVMHFSTMYHLPSKNKEKEDGYKPSDEKDNNYGILATTTTLVKRWQSEIQKKTRKQNNSSYNRMLIVGTAKAFSDRQDYDGLVVYENAINNELLSSSSFSSSLTTPPPLHANDTTSTAVTIERICCYPITGIKHVCSFATMASLLLSHNCAIISREEKRAKKRNGKDNGGGFKSDFLGYGAMVPSSSRSPLSSPSRKTILQSLGSSIIIKSIIKSMDENLGNNIGSLILMKMKLIYHIEEETIIKQPNLFVDALVKIMGEYAANLILINILNEMKQQIIYNMRKK